MAINALTGGTPYNPFSAENLARLRTDFAASGISNKPRSYGEFYNLGSGWAMPDQTAQESAWTNSAYNPTQNDNGYTRFDPNVYGGGLERSKNFEAGARTFAKYQQLKPGQPGYDHAQGALKKLKHNFGIDNWRAASPRQLFESFDLEMRGLQEDNQKENFKITPGKIAKLAAAAAATWATGGLAAGGAFGSALAGSAVGTGALAGAVGATTSGVLNNNLSLKGVAGGALLGGVGGYAKGAYGASKAGGGFTNANALGGTPNDVFGGIGSGTYNPFSGTGASGGLGLSPTNWLGKGSDLALQSIGNIGSSGGLNAWNGVTSGAGGGFTNPGAFGGPSDAAGLYTPKAWASAGGALRTGGNSAGRAIKGAAKILGGAVTLGGGAGGGPGQTQAPENHPLGRVAIPAGGIEQQIGQAVAQDPNGGGAGGFSYELPGALGGGGKGATPIGGRASSQLGAGRMQANPGRTPGYQARPFANYLMRGQ